jgi:GxxExxY protein
MPASPSTRSSEVIVHIDGASRGNPGPAAYAVVMKTAGGARLAAFSSPLGETTNNVAEYQALLAALDYALKCHYLRLKVLTDSELLARQIEGRYKVKSLELKPLHERARQAISRLETFSIQHVRREENREADRLANEVLDAAEKKRMNHQDTKTPREIISQERTRDQGTKTPREPIPEEVNRIAKEVVDAAFAVHSNLGPGLLESVYEACLAHELRKSGLAVQSQVELPIEYDGIRLDAGLRLDLLVENSVIVELKAVEAILPVHTAQVLTYLKLTGHRLGLLINFNVPLIRDGIKRMVL